MSIAKIRAAFVEKLQTLTAISTQWDNAPFTPVSGTPYQKFDLLPATPDNPTLGDDHYRERGICQIALYYPSNTGTAAIYAKAIEIQSAFKRGTTLTKDGVTVRLDRTPSITGLSYIADRAVMVISLYYFADINL